MVDILKKGISIEDLPIVKFECDFCGCVFKAGGEYAKYTAYTYINTGGHRIRELWSKAVCPNCQNGCELLVTKNWNPNAGRVLEDEEYV